MTLVLMEVDSVTNCLTTLGKSYGLNPSSGTVEKHKKDLMID